jgi:hypothetical protein
MQKTIPEKSVAEQVEAVKKDPKLHNIYDQMQRKIQAIRANPHDLIPVTRENSKTLEEIIVQNRKHSIY